MDRRLGGSQSRFGRCEDKNIALVKNRAHGYTELSPINISQRIQIILVNAS
jgi:hypothetical protein